MELDYILKPISEELQLVKEEMRLQLAHINIEQGSLLSGNEFIIQRINHLFNSDGKLLRPALVLLSAKAVNGSKVIDPGSLIKLATVVEFIHSSSLIHDDIIDESDYRRKQLSLNKQFGNHTAVLVGDIINSQFMSILADLDNVSYEKRILILKTFSGTIKKMCIGEIYEQRIKKDNIKTSINDYLEIINKKTASLMSASCLCGAYISGANEKECKILENYGHYLGLVFQIADDFTDKDSLFDSTEELIEYAEKFAMLAENEINKLKDTTIKQNLIYLNKYTIAIAKRNFKPGKKVR